MTTTDIGDLAVSPHAMAKRRKGAREVFWTHYPTASLARRAFSQSSAAGFRDIGANLRVANAVGNYLKDVCVFAISAWREIQVNRRYGLRDKFGDFDRRLQAANIEMPLREIDFAGLALDVLGTRIECKGNTGQLSMVLRHGEPCVVIANHAFAPIDGLMLMSLVHGHRHDYSLLVNAGNALTTAVPEYGPRLIPVELSEGLIKNADLDAVRKSRTKALRIASRRLAVEGGCLIMFPAGRISRATAWGKPITDAPWLDGVGFLIRTLDRRNIDLKVLPCFLDTHLGGAQASARYHEALFEHPTHLPAALMRAALNPPPAIDLHVGDAIPARCFRDLAADTITRVLRESVYALAPRIPVATRCTSLQLRPTSRSE